MVLLKISRSAPCNMLLVYVERGSLTLEGAADFFCFSEHRVSTLAQELHQQIYPRCCRVIIHIFHLSMYTRW